MRSTLTPSIVIACVALGLSGAVGTGCDAVKENPRTAGTLIGAGAGAGIGAGVAGHGKKTEGALIGAGAGAAGGWLIGNAADEQGKKSDKEERQRARDEYNNYYDDRAREAGYTDAADQD